MNERPEEAAPKDQPEVGAGPRKRAPIALALAGLIVAGAIGAGADALAHRGRSVTFVALPPAPISSMKEDAMVALKGTVDEAFGNKFVVEDASGRALIETGRRGEGREIVVKGEEVTIQGRFAHGFVHAAAISHADGRSDALDPPPPGPRP